MTGWQICRNLLKNSNQIRAALLGQPSEIVLKNDLINMHAKCGRMDLARQVFDKMPKRNVVSWTALICGYLRQGNLRDSLLVFYEMGFSDVKPNEFTFSTNFKACGYLGNAVNGVQIHGLCVKFGFESFPAVGNSIVDMYARCGRVVEFEKMFDLMPVKELISWNVMIEGYSLVGMFEKALIMFREMQKQGEMVDGFTFTSTLKACNGLEAIQQGSQIHGNMIVSGYPLPFQIIVAGALIDLYVKCGYLYEARKVFDQQNHKSIVSRSSLIHGYAQQGNLIEAKELFLQLTRSNTRLDEIVISTMISVFADLALVEEGKQMHSYTIKMPFNSETSVGNSILDMYLKCGLTEEGELYFNEMKIKNVISWTVMITGYAKHGLGREAIQLFEKMQKENMEPDEVTYLAILSACSHSGLLKESRKYFSKLCEDSKIRPRVDHYSCMVDILGRAGCLKEAKKLIEDMPIKPDTGIWQTLLSACRLHGDVEMAKEVGETVLKLDTSNPTNYVMLSNIFADAGYWKESQRVRETVKSKGLKKEAGRSWVQIYKEVHCFYNADEMHPLTKEIHILLKEMERRIKEEVGYATDVRFSLYDVEEESKVESLKFHSEKLAIGLALVTGGIESGGKGIRIFKNLRVCGDCHEFIKGLSKVLQKVFVVRDASRFHKFEDGLCSCRDYW